MLRSLIILALTFGTPAVVHASERGEDWAAVAVGDEVGSFGAAALQKTRFAARRAAIKHCQSKGATNCEALAETKGACIALAEGAQPTSDAIGWAYDEAVKETASKIANAECVAQNRGEDCRIVVSFCSDNK